MYVLILRFTILFITSFIHISPLGVYVAFKYKGQCICLESWYSLMFSFPIKQIVGILINSTILAS